MIGSMRATSLGSLLPDLLHRELSVQSRLVQPKLQSSWQYHITGGSLCHHWVLHSRVSQPHLLRMQPQKKVAATGWAITSHLYFSGREKGKKPGFMSTPLLSGAEGHWRLQFVAYKAQICLLFIRTQLVLREILLNSHYVYRTIFTNLGLVLFSFDFFSKTFYQEEDFTLPPLVILENSWPLQFYLFNYTESVSLMKKYYWNQEGQGWVCLFVCFCLSAFLLGFQSIESVGFASLVIHRNHPSLPCDYLLLLSC